MSVKSKQILISHNGMTGEAYFQSVFQFQDGAVQNRRGKLSGDVDHLHYHFLAGSSFNNI